ncbi:unnamed protein product [Durusdinium trenchii]|uniref:Uncharacterized protein n=1 Tax=Durusdinium trenchii TaxID=1381693 RepID=A0ABP0S602_9DINO
MASRPKLRLLCLHGRCQTSATFQGKIERLIAKSASCADFVFVDGPVELPLQHEERVNTKGWWEEGEARSLHAPRIREVLSQAWSELGPFEGVLGFSEGGLVAQLACHWASEGESPFASLRFGIFAASPELTESCAAEGMKSLHMASSKDTVVPLEESKRLAARFSNAEWLEHEAGHVFSQRSEDLRRLGEFLELRREQLLPEELASVEEVEADDRLSQEQKDEVEALASIFMEELTIFKPTCPVRLAVKVLHERASLRFFFPPLYPQVPCVCDLDSEDLGVQLRRRELLEAVEAAREPEGFPSVMAMVQEAQRWIEEHGVTIDQGLPSDGTAEEDEPAEAWWLCEDAQVDQELLTQAEKKAAELLPDGSSGSRSWARQCGAGAYGKPWRFTVGLVGKPSAGKSTLFNAATRCEKEAAMAPHPFTTIDPNVEPGWFAVPCPSVTLQCQDECEPEHGRADRGQRRFPLLVKDVAGLVPGAYLGYGRGNAFLNDLLDADSLVHVVDASGRSDAEGVDHGKAGKGHDPLKDVEWVRQEIHMWIFCNVRAKWHSVRKRAKFAPLQPLAAERLFGLFTGYHCSQQLVAQVYESTGHRIATLPQDVLNWSEFDLHLLVACFLRVRFPIVIALNKADTAEAQEHIVRAQAALGNAVAVSARSELWLLQQQRKGHLTYLEGGGPQSIAITEHAPEDVRDQVSQLRQKVLEVYGSTGVMEVLSRAVLQRSPVFCCPVSEFTTLQSLSSGGYSTKSKLVTMMMLRPLSTVEEVHAALKNEKLVRGDLVRAEMLHISTGQVSVLRREEVLKPEGAQAATFVLRILTNKKAK